MQITNLFRNLKKSFKILFNLWFPDKLTEQFLLQNLWKYRKKCRMARHNNFFENKELKKKKL